MIFYLCILGVISSSGDLRFAPMALWALPLGPGDTSDAKVRETPAFSSSYGQLSPVLSILVLACSAPGSIWRYLIACELAKYLLRDGPCLAP